MFYVTTLVFLLYSSKPANPVFVQMTKQLVSRANELRYSTRAWKVSLIGEAADDVGGVFDETVAQMCEVRCCPLLHLQDVASPQQFGHV